MTRTVVVGAGLGGLTAAARLAALGHHVTIVEATHQVGGKAGRRIVGGLPFDTGPSLLTMPHVLERTLAACGLDEDALDLRRVQPVTRYRFADGSHVDLRDDDGAADALEAWSPGAGRDWQRYLSTCAEMWEASESILAGLPPWPPRRPTEADPAPDPRSALAVRPHLTLRQLARQLTSEPRLRHVIERFATYAGADPRRAPAALALAGYVEHAFGVWYPGVPGGLHAIPQLLAQRAQELGATLLLGEPVESIRAAGGRVRSVRTAARELPADAVVFGGDQRALGRLIAGAPLSPPSLAARLAAAAGRSGRRTPSVSGLALLLAVRPDRPTEVHHEIRFPSDYDAEFDAIYGRRELPQDPTLYVSVPTVTERREGIAVEDGRPRRQGVPGSGALPGAGPADAASSGAAPAAGSLERWFVLVNAPAGLPDDVARGATARIEARLGLRPGEVVARDVRTPADLASETGSPDGAIYGDAPHGRLGTLRRPGPIVPGVRGLLRAGGTSHPGGGVPLVMMGGLTAARLIDQAR